MYSRQHTSLHDTRIAIPPASSPRAAVHVEAVLQSKVEQFEEAHRYHMGYPYNLAFQQHLCPGFDRFLINNLGDPYVGSHYASHVCDLEREVIAELVDLWDGDALGGELWGAVGASGTEGNLWAMYLAREALPGAVLVYSDQAHYSIPKAARLLGMRAVTVATHEDGAMDVRAFGSVLGSLWNIPVAVALTCGTTFKGAHDDIGAVCLALAQSGRSRRDWFVHCDGALNAMVIPFLDGPQTGIRPSFAHPIDSVSTSGHKMIGTPMPCGVLVARREHVENVSRAISYLRSNDTTLMGSKNGHAVLALWARFSGHGRPGYRDDAQGCVARAEELAARLRQRGVPVLLNPYSLTLAFPEPHSTIVRKFQLACSEGEAHCIIMPNVSSELVRHFGDEYLAWWRTH